MSTTESAAILGEKKDQLNIYKSITALSLFDAALMLNSCVSLAAKHMLHIDKVVSFSMNHDLSNVKFTLYSVSINIVIKKVREILILDSNSKAVVSKGYNQSNLLLL